MDGKAVGMYKMRKKLGLISILIFMATIWGGVCGQTKQGYTVYSRG